MRAGTTLRLAMAGARVDGLRISLTSLVAALTTLALLAATTVSAIGPGDGPYTSDLLNEGGLHPGLVIALLGLCVPTLVLLAQASRVGAPARDRRLSALRLAGATPREIVRLVATESGVAALVGSVLGAAVYVVLRHVLTQEVRGTFQGYQPASVTGHFVTRTSPHALRFPTDVAIPWWSYLAVGLGVPAVVVLITAAAQRRVAHTPFGTQRRSRTRVPRALPMVLLVGGVAIFSGVAALANTGFGQRLDVGAFTAIMMAALLILTAGLLTGQAAVTALIGRHLACRTSSPAALLAARRMIADPFAGTRATAVLLVAVLVGSGAQRLRAVTVAGRSGSDKAFFASAYHLVDVVLVVVAVLAAGGLLIAASEGIVARRRTYAAVVAVGAPRSTVGRAVLLELLLPLLPSVVLSAAAGTSAAIALFGWRALDSAHPRVVGIEWLTLLGVVAAALAITAAVTAVSLVFLRRVTDIGELRTAA